MANKKHSLHPIGIFLIAYQVIFLALLPFYLYFGTVHLSMVIGSLILFFLTGISITGGYHRYYSHRCYKAHPVVEAVILFFGTLATQGSVIRWSHDHRLHHAHVDTDEDPYSIKKGFWYAHFLWLLDKPREINRKIVSDLFDKKLVAFQHNYYLPLVIGMNAAVFLIMGALLGDYLGAFFLALWGRMFFLHHSTWFINSLAHTWGSKPFSQEQSAVNNYVISFLTFGEGYHNYHHTFANDYRNGIRWYHFDPTKWTIWGLHKLGLASNLKRMDEASIKKRMVIEHKNLLTNRLKEIWWIKCDELEVRVDALSDAIIEKLNKLSELNLQSVSVPSINRELVAELQQELKQLQQSIRADWDDWTKLSRHILKLKPGHA